MTSLNPSNQGDPGAHNGTFGDLGMPPEHNINGQNVEHGPVKDGDEAEEGCSEEVWKDQEIDKLIDAITEKQNDWDAISAEYFNGKFLPEQCVLKFLQLPLTENMLAKIAKGNLSLRSGREADCSYTNQREMDGDISK